MNFKKILMWGMLALLLFAVDTTVQKATAASTAVTQYNQTWADVDNGAAAPWTALTIDNYVWAVPGDRGVLVVNTTTTATADGINLTLKAGDPDAGAWKYVLGDQVFTLATNYTYVLGPFESARFKQENETITFTLNATTVGADAFFVTMPK
jgi:hypothetical protein